MSAIEEALKAADELQTKLANSKNFPCIHPKDGVSCTAQHEGMSDRDGRQIFYFASDCKVAQTFCPSCLAYWHVAVARNCLFALERVTP